MNAFPHITYAAKTDVGRKRQNNEDAFGVFPDAGIFCVADGMGGGDDGEIASAAVVKSVGSFAMAHVSPPGVGYAAEDVASGVSMSVDKASAWIFSRAAERKLSGCGSTFVGICLDATAPAKAIALHAGDSRLYRIRGASIKQITKDHSAAEMIGAKDESAVNPCFRGVILRAVGVQPSVDVDRTPLPLKGGDRIVICSDGLSKMVDDRTIAEIVHGGTTPESAADSLVAAANEAGGTDNVTVVVIFVGKLPLARPAISMELPESPTGTTEDGGESDTSSTGAGGGFSAEADTEEEPQTLATMTVKVQGAAGLEECRGGNAPARPLQIKKAAPRTRIRDRRVLRVALYVFAALLSLVLAILCGIYVARRAKVRDAAAEAERQRNVQKLAEVNASAMVDERKGESAGQNANESIVESIELEMEKVPDDGESIPPKGDDLLHETQETRNDGDSDGAKTHAVAAHVPPSLVYACSPTNSEAFVKTVRRFPNKGAVEALQMRFRPLCDETLPPDRRVAIAAAVTADVQDIARELWKYAERRVGHIDAALSEHTTRVEFKEKLAAEREGLVAFMAVTERFVEVDPSSAEAQAACADLMLGVVKWFEQVN